MPLIVSISKQVQPPFIQTKTLYPIARSLQSPEPGTVCRVAGFGETKPVYANSL